MNRAVNYVPGEIHDIQVKGVWIQAHLQGIQGDQIEVLAAGDEASMQDLSIRLENGHLIVEQPQHKLLDRWIQGRWLEVTLRIPQQWQGDVSLGSVTGPFEVSQLTVNQLTLDTVSGQMDLKALVVAGLRARTVSGSIRVANVSGQEANLRSITGTITLLEAGFAKVKVVGVTAEVNLTFLNPFQTLEVQSISAPISVALPGGQVDVSFRTVSGKVSFDGFTTSPGAPKVSASTVSGNVLITGLTHH